MHTRLLESDLRKADPHLQAVLLSDIQGIVFITTAEAVAAEAEAMAAANPNTATGNVADPAVPVFPGANNIVAVPGGPQWQTSSKRRRKRLRRQMSGRLHNVAVNMEKAVLPALIFADHI